LSGGDLSAVGGYGSERVLAIADFLSGLSPSHVNEFLDDPRVVENILRHLGVWHDRPPKPPPQRLPGPYTYEPCVDVEPMHDYENMLTD
jgi:hypothetical protein